MINGHINKHMIDDAHLQRMQQDVSVRDLLKVFVNYHLGPDKSMLCLWRNGYLSCALREQTREQELQSRLNEWLQD
jgi:hypothetical protein